MNNSANNITDQKGRTYPKGRTHPQQSINLVHLNILVKHKTTDNKTSSPVESTGHYPYSNSKFIKWVDHRDD